MSILDDQYLRLRLSAEPEFVLRLHEFVVAYGLSDQPALVVQARPVASISGFDVADIAKQARFKGSGHAQNQWNGLNSRTSTVTTFNGIAGWSNYERQLWASELHHDAHFIAGVWTFPTLPQGFGQEGVAAITDGYAVLFRDFLRVIATTCPGALRFHITATLTNAPKLHLCSTPNEWHERSQRPPIALANLQWPIETGDPGSDANGIVHRMSLRLIGACGKDLPATM